MNPQPIYVPWEWASFTFKLQRHTFIVTGFASSIEVLKDVAKELATLCLLYKERMLCSSGSGGSIFVTRKSKTT